MMSTALPSTLVVIFVLMCARSSKAYSEPEDHPLIYVDSTDSKAVNDTTCWKGNIETPCKSLSIALEGILHLAENNDTHPWLYVNPGDYLLHKSFVFSGLDIRDFGIVGNATIVAEHFTPTVKVYCSQDAGLQFINITTINLQAIWWIGCGVPTNTTSLLDSTQSELIFSEFRVGLYFLLCKDVTFDHVWVTNSPGISILVYSTVGENKFEYCNISQNSVLQKDTEKYPAGGGLYIEFSYCIPDNAFVQGTCNSEDINNIMPIEHVSNSTYHIKNCHFYQNQADIESQNLAGNKTYISNSARNHSSLGRGGGMSIFFKGQSTRNNVYIANSEFVDNKAVWGGGLFMEYQDNSSYNDILVNKTVFVANKVEHDAINNNGTAGGGVKMGFIFYDNSHVHHNKITFDTCDFEQNSAHWGGGLSFFATREQGVTGPTNSIGFVHCTWTNNTAWLGAAIYVAVWHAVTEGYAVHATFNSTIIQNHTMYYLHKGHRLPLGAMYADSIPVQFYDSVDFLYNRYTALAAISTSLDFGSNCRATFAFNSGRNGGAISLFGYAFLRASEESLFLFSMNSAELKGGAIYATTSDDHDLLSSRNCFIRYLDFEVSPNDWKASYFFINNTAGGRNNSIYTTSILSCHWGASYGPADHRHDYNNGSTLCWQNWNYNTNCSEQIQTDVAGFKRANMQALNVYPGQKTFIDDSLLSYDDFSNRTMYRTVLTAEVSSHTKKASIASSSKYISDSTIVVNGIPNTTNITIDLYTIDPRVVYTDIQINLLDCPTGFVPTELTLETVSADNVTYVCASASQFGGRLTCTEHNFSSNLTLRGNWIGIHNSKLLGGNTPYTDSLEQSKLQLPQNSSEVSDHLCSGFNRKGTLCGDCSDGYGPSINSDNYKCVQCDETRGLYSWVFFLLTEILPLTIFFFILVLFNISLTSGPANAFIFFSQVITEVFFLYTTTYEASTTIKTLKAVYTSIYGIWSLNFLDPVEKFQYCLHPKLQTIHIILLEYVVAIYPLLLIILLYTMISLYNRGIRPIVVLCRPLHHCLARFRSHWNLQRSVVDAFAAFLLLSYTKFTMTSIYLLRTSQLVKQEEGYEDLVVYYQGTMKAYTGTHIIYIIVALSVLLVFVITPPLLLILYPTKIFHASLRCFTCGRCQITGGKIELFLNSFYGCFKDGTKKGTRDMRFFAGLYFVFRLILAASTLNDHWLQQYLQQNIFCIAVVLLFSLARPYRNELHNRVDSTIFLILAAISILSQYNFQQVLTYQNYSTVIFVIEYILIWCPFIYMVGYLLNILWSSYLSKVSRGVRCSTNGDNSIIGLIDERPKMYNDTKYNESASGSKRSTGSTDSTDLLETTP